MKVEVREVETTGNFVVATPPTRFPGYVRSVAGNHVHAVRRFELWWAQRYPASGLSWAHYLRPRFLVTMACGYTCYRPVGVDPACAQDVVACPRCFPRETARAPGGLCICPGKRGQPHRCSQAVDGTWGSSTP